MYIVRTMLARLLGFMGKHAAERDLDAELQAHIESLTEENIRRGMNAEQARWAARREFGGLQQTREAYLERRGLPFLETLPQDLRFGARMLLKNPGFTLVAVLTLALGIGANTAIFSVVNSVLLRPLAYADSDFLVTILHDGDNPVAPANYLDWRERCHSFTAMGAAEHWGANLTNIASPEHIIGLKVTTNLFPMLGVQPMLGRMFSLHDDQPGAEREVILSYGLWNRRFVGDATIVGKAITLDGEPYMIVGVMPSSFKFAPVWATRAEIWAPMVFGDRAHDRGGQSLRIFARLKPAVSLAQARAEVAAVTAQLEQQFPATNRNVVVTPLLEKVVGRVETPLLLLFGAVGFVLLIASSNVAHMLLSRAAARYREIAVRSALGAPRTRIIRQLLTENILLTAMGASAGLLLAIWGTHLLVRLSPAIIPRVETVSVDARAILFLTSVSFLAVALFGTAPAFQTSRVNLSDVLKESARGTGGASRRGLRNFLIASEFALALILLIGAGLMVRTFVALQSVDAGFNPHNVLSMIVSVAGSPESASNRRAIFYHQVLDRIRTIPGVESGAGINHLPIYGDMWGYHFMIEGRPKPRPGEFPGAVYRVATPGYFETMRLPLVRGRAFSEADDSRAPGVVIINERAASAYWPGEDPIGEHISFDTDANGSPAWLTIIGIAKDAKQAALSAPANPELYVAAFQSKEFLGEGDSHSAYITLVIRAQGDPAVLATTAKRAVWSLDSNLPISEVLTMDDVVAFATSQPRFETMLFVVFAGLALIMAGVGIYGVMSYLVSLRSQEIGIRISLGAKPADVFGLVLREGMLLALAGLAAGTVGALLLSRLLGNLLYGVTATDPLTFLFVVGLLMVVALVANYLPARRAMRVDPMVALRFE